MERGFSQRLQVNLRCTQDFLDRVDEYLAGPGRHFRSRSDLIRYATLLYLDGVMIGRGIGSDEGVVTGRPVGVRERKRVTAVGGVSEVLGRQEEG